jgi:hypothetical protein
MPHRKIQRRWNGISHIIGAPGRSGYLTREGPEYLNRLSYAELNDPPATFFDRRYIEIRCRALDHIGRDTVFPKTMY